MITITAKDRIFVLVAAPLAVLACYLFWLRPARANEVRRQERAILEMGEPEELRQQGILLRKRLASLEDGPDTGASTGGASVPAVASTVPAARLRQVVGVLQERSVRVVRSEWIEPDDDLAAEPDAAVVALRAAGALERPDCWNLELESSYGAFVGALAAFRTNGLPVVPVSVSMDKRGRADRCRWRMKLWL